MEDINILAIVIPNILAFSALCFQFISNQKSQTNEKLKMFYKDRLDSFKELNQQLMKMTQSIEYILNTERVLIGKNTLEELFENKERKIPKELSDSFKAAIYNSTFLGRNEFMKIVELNQMFISENLNRLLEQIEVDYFYQIPEPLEINITVRFLENKLETLKELKKRVNNECKKIMNV